MYTNYVELANFPDTIYEYRVEYKLKPQESPRDEDKTETDVSSAEEDAGHGKAKNQTRKNNQKGQEKKSKEPRQPALGEKKLIVKELEWKYLRCDWASLVTDDYNVFLSTKDFGPELEFADAEYSTRRGELITVESVTFSEPRVLSITGSSSDLIEQHSEADHPTEDPTQPTGGVEEAPEEFDPSIASAEDSSAAFEQPAAETAQPKHSTAHDEPFDVHSKQAPANDDGSSSGSDSDSDDDSDSDSDWDDDMDKKKPLSSALSITRALNAFIADSFE